MNCVRSYLAKLLNAQTQPLAPRQMTAVDFRQCTIAEAGDGVLALCVVKGVQSEGMDKAILARSALSASRILPASSTSNTLR